jgi:adenylosuccinate synthase
VELLDRQRFEEQVRTILDEKNFYLKNYLKADTVDPDTVIAEYAGYAERLQPYVDNVSVTIDQAIKNGQQVLFEGAQGTHLDIDHGTYPYVTSSNTVAANACSGAGLGPRHISGVTGIVKAYTTRVGAGPFPTELFDATGDAIQAKGAEFGATTGRRRRCGWLDTVIVRNAVRLNGLTGLAITKLDVLGDLDEIKICDAYEYKGQTLSEFPTNLNVLAECRPIYETLPGWKTDISGIRSLDQLPEQARSYIQRLETLVETPVDIISVGPGREETIVLNNLLAR